MLFTKNLLIKGPKTKARESSRNHGIWSKRIPKLAYVVEKKLIRVIDIYNVPELILYYDGDCIYDKILISLLTQYAGIQWVISNESSYFLSGPKCCVGCHERWDVRIGIQIDQSEQGTWLHGKSTQQTPSNMI